jgi:hypothetical protein
VRERERERDRERERSLIKKIHICKHFGKSLLPSYRNLRIHQNISLNISLHIHTTGYLLLISHGKEGRRQCWSALAIKDQCQMWSNVLQCQAKSIEPGTGLWKSGGSSN